MDDMNNNNKNFGEESFSEQNTNQYDPYSSPEQNTQNTQSDPYASGVYRQPVQNTQPAPNVNGAASDKYDPYTQPNAYDPYAQQNGGFNGYPQQMVYPTGMAVASLVIGIISIMSILFMMMFPPLFVLPVVGIVLGAVYKSKHYPVGKGMSTAGIVTSVLSIVLVVAIFVLAVGMMASIIENGRMPELMQYIKDINPAVYEQYYEMFHGQYPEWFEGISAVFANIAAFFVR